MHKTTRLIAPLLLATSIAAQEITLPNASFEKEEEGRPTAWTPRTWQGEGSFEPAEIGHTGGRSAAIESPNGGDLSWYALVPVRPFARYRLSGWIKTEGLVATTGRGALFNVHGLRNAATPALSGTKDWTEVQIEFEIGAVDCLHVNCLFGGWGLAKGKAWYDDLRLELLSARTLDPRLVLDVRKTGEPVSKYIYGQFIEHLGRCIYGGIWAEMLEDRKFFYSVGDQSSPWKVVGDPSRVRMVTKDPFVGEHTPEFTPDGERCGISQGGLGVVEGRSYTGYIWLAASSSAGPISIHLDDGSGTDRSNLFEVREAMEFFQKFQLRFTARKTTDEARLWITASGKGGVRIGTLSLMPDDNVRGMRADTLSLLKELDAPIYRWPGGNFVSGYDWRDGIGNRDRRPPRKNPAWSGIESNDFGLDEFMRFCREVETEPLVVVNTGLGDVQMAVDELRYANAPADDEIGKLRAGNGRPGAYHVRWWGLGNEMYGDWQLGHMPLEKYLEKHSAFAKAMRSVDPSIKLVAVGAVGRWSEQMLTHCAEDMDLISEHFYRNRADGLMAHVGLIPAAVEEKARAHRAYREKISALKGKDIRISLDEWNYWYGPHLYGELGTRYFLRDALGIAAGLNAMVRNSDLFFMANYAQTVNVIGCIKTTKTAAAFATTALPLKLYRHHFGDLPVALVSDPTPFDIAAALSADRKAITIAVVNPMRARQVLPLAIEGARINGQGSLWLITGASDMLYNEPGAEPRVAIEKRSLAGISDKLVLEPVSVSLYRLELE